MAPFCVARPEAIRTAFLLSQGGEFAFVLLSLAKELRILPDELNRLLIIVVVRRCWRCPRWVPPVPSRHSQTCYQCMAPHRLGFHAVRRTSLQCTACRCCPWR